MTTGEHDSIIERFRNGDHDAFRELVELYAPALKQRVERRLDQAVRRKVSVADVIQDAQLAAFESRRSFEHRGPRSFRNWLLGIVDNRIRRIRDGLSSRKREVAREVTRGVRPDTAVLLEAHVSPSQAAIARELHERTWNAIEELPEPYREVLQLIHRDTLEIEEVAARLGRTLAATRKLHARALLRLSDKLRIDRE